MVPRPMPAAPLVVRPRYFIVAPRPLPRCASQVLIAVPRLLPRCASQVLDRGAEADARGAAQVLDRGAQAAARSAAMLPQQGKNNAVDVQRNRVTMNTASKLLPALSAQRQGSPSGASSAHPHIRFPYVFTRAQRTRVIFCQRYWFLCHLGLY